MVNTLNHIRIAGLNHRDRARIELCLISREPCGIEVKKVKLTFDPENRIVTVEERSGDHDPKFQPCRMPYEIFIKVLNWTFNDLEGLEWLN